MCTQPGEQPLALPQPLPRQEADQEFIGELLSFLDDAQKRAHEAILRQATDRASIEETHLRSMCDSILMYTCSSTHTYGLTVDVAVVRQSTSRADRHTHTYSLA